MIGKKLRKIIAIALNILYAKKEKYILLMFQSLTQNVKTSCSKWRKMALFVVKKLLAFLRGINIILKY